MDEAMLSCRARSSRRDRLLAECRLHGISELAQSDNAQPSLTTADAGRDQGQGAVRPLDGKPHAPARRVLHVDVPPAVLAPGGADDQQRHASERMNR